MSGKYLIKDISNFYEGIMKKIKTSSYIKKEALWGDLPGDPGLPPGVSNQMIDEQFGGPEPVESSKQSGEYESNIDWEKETMELVSLGEEVDGLPQRGIGDIIFYYEYDSDDLYGSIRLLNVKQLVGGQYQELRANPDTKQSVFDKFKDDITNHEKRIIKEQSEGSPGFQPDTREENY